MLDPLGCQRDVQNYCGATVASISGVHSAFHGCPLGEGVVVRCHSDLKKHSYRAIQGALEVDRAGRHCRMCTPDVELPRSPWIGPFVRSSTLVTNQSKGEADAGISLAFTRNSVPMTPHASQAKVATLTSRLRLTVIGAAAGVYCLVIDSPDRYWQVTIRMQKAAQRPHDIMGASLCA